MAITTLELEAVLEEMAPALTGGWVQRIGEPAPDMISLDIRVPGRTIRLLISIDPDHARLHLVTKPHPNPPVPPPFCQFLRARLLGSRLDWIAQINHDRIVRLDLTAAGGQWSLIAELLGRQPDLLVTDGDAHVIATYRRADSRIGSPYRPPSRPTSQQIVPPASPARLGRTDTPFPVSAELEERYGRSEEALQIERITNARKQLLRKTIKKQQRLMAALTGDLAKASQYERYARYGELLKSTLGRLRKGQPAITVLDYFNEQMPELTIPLNPAKTPQGNMDEYFAKHKKFLTAQKELIPRIDSIQREVRHLEQELQEIEQGTWQATRPGRPVKPGGLSGRQVTKPREERRGPFRRFTSADGLPIYVGRNARENDALTFTFAKSDDLWLHAQGTPGSHVIVRLEKGSDVPGDTLRDAATLALLYSDLKKAGKGDVIYTRRKCVRKAKGAAPGSVTVTQEKTLFVRLDKARLDALKHRSSQQTGQAG
jgi:predicted ribosome quality control (RQC) complex YloA/Tae2 family protein